MSGACSTMNAGIPHLPESDVTQRFVLDECDECCICSEVRQINWYHMDQAGPFRVQAPVCYGCFDPQTAAPGDKQHLSELLRTSLVAKVQSSLDAEMRCWQQPATSLLPLVLRDALLAASSEPPATTLQPPAPTSSSVVESEASLQAGAKPSVAISVSLSLSLFLCRGVRSDAFEAKWHHCLTRASAVSHRCAFMGFSGGGATLRRMCVC